MTSRFSDSSPPNSSMKFKRVKKKLTSGNPKISNKKNVKIINERSPQKLTSGNPKISNRKNVKNINERSARKYTHCNPKNDNKKNGRNSNERSPRNELFTKNKKSLDNKFDVRQSKIKSPDIKKDTPSKKRRKSKTKLIQGFHSADTTTDSNCMSPISKKNNKRNKYKYLDDLRAEGANINVIKDQALMDSDMNNSKIEVSDRAPICTSLEKDSESDKSHFSHLHDAEKTNSDESFKTSKKRKLINADPKIVKVKKVKTDINKMKKMMNSNNSDEFADEVQNVVVQDPLTSSDSSDFISKKKSKNTLSFCEKAREKLRGGHFRYLNEQLYTMSGDEALQVMTKDEESFHKYHEGYNNQVKMWPINPVNNVIDFIKKRSPKLIVADFGCGDAKVAQSVKNETHSFDLVALNEHATACNMSKVPLSHNFVDIGIFCLSLMSTDFVDCLIEANRVLKEEAILIIVEIQSRFESIKDFIRRLKLLGFILIKKEFLNKMFVWMHFIKNGKPENDLPLIELKPCLYKKR